MKETADHIQIPKLSRIKVRQMMSRKWRPVANQFIIRVDGGEYFQSYDSIIAYRGDNGLVILDINNWDYSRTTGKYRNAFLGEGIEDTRKRIKSGEYLFANLNQ